MSARLIFLRFVINQYGIKANPIKDQTIQDWPTSKIDTKVRSFHGLATFYRRFIKGLSNNTRPIIDFLKKSNFRWSLEQEKASNC